MVMSTIAVTLENEYKSINNIVRLKRYIFIKPGMVTRIKLIFIS